MTKPPCDPTDGTGAQRMPADIVYLRPASGGILDYSQSVLAILREALPALRITVRTIPAAVRPFREGLRLARQVRAWDGPVLAEMGAGDASMLWCLSRLVRERPVVVTVHDPGVVVQGLLGPSN